MATPPTNLVITQQDGQIDTLPLPKNVTASEFTAHLHKSAGYWVGQRFVPWSVITGIVAE